MKAVILDYTDDKLFKFLAVEHRSDFVGSGAYSSYYKFSLQNHNIESIDATKPLLLVMDDDKVFLVKAITLRKVATGWGYYYQQGMKLTPPKVTQ